MKRYLILCLLFSASAISYARCDKEFADWKEKQIKLSKKKDLRNVSGLVGFVFYPLWIVTGVSYSKAKRLKKEVAIAEQRYHSCMARN